MGKHDKYEFDDDVKKECWRKAAILLGRDPERWRLDPNGAPVLHALHGRAGLCGWNYDHIVPKSLAKRLPEAEREKLDKLENCQVLQSAANKRKSNKMLCPMELKTKACEVEFNDAFLDLVELAVHGNLTDDMGAIKCKSFSKAEAVASMISGNRTPCQVPTCNELPLVGTKYCKQTVSNIAKSMRGLNMADSN